MRKVHALALLTGIFLCGNAMAQQSSPGGPQQASAAGTQKPQTGTKPATGTDAKSSQGAGAGAASGTTKPLATEKEKQSYAIGADFGMRLRQQPIEVDPAIVAQGVKDALSGAKLALTDEEARAVFAELQEELKKNQEVRMAQLGDTNKKEGAAFLAANRTKQGVVALPSGLQYKIVMQGTGPKPAASDTVVCNYRGTLINGKEFDSSYKRGQPASFPVGGVIKGWTEALQLMPVGSKWELYIPSDLAYGDRGAGSDIGPGATLVFEVELISIQPKK